MFHENHRESFKVVYARGHTDEEIAHYNDVNEQVIQAIKDNSPIKICERVAMQIYQTDKKNVYQSEDTIMRYILDDVHKRGDWYPNSFQMRRWVMRIMDTLVSLTDHPTVQWEWIRNSWINNYYK